MVDYRDKSNANDKVYFVINQDSPAGLNAEFIHTCPKYKVPLYKLTFNVLCHTHTHTHTHTSIL
jgi:siroheme synthase (precorrin-2 oxidase/ferrochelatase)